MILLNPGAFYLLFSSLLILLLHLLRARERQRDVSALFLWEGLAGDPQSRAARIRQKLDPLVLLQLATLLAFVVAVAQPAVRMRTPSLSGLAVVLDGSASMQTIADDGRTRYEQAVDEARSLLERYASESTAVIQLSSRPAILAHPGLSLSDLQTALLRSEPTWYGDGTSEALLSLLGSTGGASQFEHVVVLTDHRFPDLPDSFDTILFDGGDNLALTSFSARENPTGGGVSALVTARNHSDAYQDVTIRIEDRENQTRLSVLMPPGSVETYVIPFPNSRGTLFTAHLDPLDGFVADNRRFFSLDRPMDVRVLWLGTDSRYLMAALRSVAPITLVDRPEDADLIVAYNVHAPTFHAGTILLVHADMEGLFVQGDTLPTAAIDVAIPDHPILHEVNPASFRIRQAPTAALPQAAAVVLSAAAVPLLATYEDVSRTVFYLAPDILDTNLPITVDFPLLIRNILATLAHISPTISYRSAEVGQPISLAGRGNVEAIYDPQEQRIPLPAEVSVFRPASPGFHTLITDRGAFAVAVNVPAAESALGGTGSVSQAADRTDQSVVWFLPLWPFAAALAALLLVAEALVHASRRSLVRRAR